MRSLNLAIPDDSAAKLSELARKEYRGTRQQAAVLLVEAIDRAVRAGRERRDHVSRAQPEERDR